MSGILAARISSSLLLLEILAFDLSLEGSYDIKSTFQPFSL
jgi:hypothetical protein